MRLINKNTGPAEAAQRSPTFTHGSSRRPHPIEVMNAKTIRTDRLQTIRDRAAFILKIVAIAACTIVATKIADKAIVKAAYQINQQKQEDKL